MKISEMPPEQREKVRHYNRERKREERRQERLKRDTALLAEGEFRSTQRTNAEGEKERAAMGLCFFGEMAPGVDGTTVEAALAVCREFARLLAQPDIQPNESLKQFETRIGQVWLERGGPFLNRRNQELRKGWGDYWREKRFEEVFKFLPNAAKPVEVSVLPPLPVIPKLETTPVVPAPVVVSDADTAAERRILEQKKAQSRFGLPADALQYLEHGR